MNKLALNKSPSHYTDNTPNAAKLLSSLRQLDYSSSTAICDIIDNSIDAGAEVIKICLFSEGKKNINRIEIWDNGSGMSQLTLNEALKLGSDTRKNPQYDLGRYGMGLITASLSIGEYLQVTTLQDGEVYSAIQDLEIIRDTNSFTIDLHKVEGKDSDKFLNELQKNTDSKSISGTCVVIDSIDRWQWTQVSATERHLGETLGQVFRKFILSGRKIFINDIEVKALDPIYDFNPQLLAEENLSVDGENINIKLFELQDQGRALNEHNGMNIKNQGFYILRNNREISTGQTFNLWNKHNDLNLFRAELSYSGSLDYLMNAGFTKQSINPEVNQSVYDKLKAFVMPHVKQIRARSKRRQEDNRDKKEDFSDVEKYITQKAHLLKTPLAIKEKRDPKSDESKPTQSPKEVGSPRLDITKKKRIDLNSLKVSFRTKSMDKAGPLYTAEMERDTTVINWNIDHPFYIDFIIPYEDDKNVINPICFLIYSLASAELRSRINSDSEDVIENIRADLSQNLRILMNS